MVVKGGGRVVVLDNGGGSCKVGFAGERNPVKVIPNFVSRAKNAAGRKLFIADQVEGCDEVQGLAIRRPFDRGYLVNWEVQKDIWEHAFKNILKVRPADCVGLVLTEPLFNLQSMQATMDEVVFEEYGFPSYCAVVGPSLAHAAFANDKPDSLLARTSCSLVVDIGFSFTHSVPICGSVPILHAVRRINLGGKVLTNYLKELVSYRAWNVMDETYIMEDVKEKLCFVSGNLLSDLEEARKPTSYLRCEYVLPDGLKHKRGFVKNPQSAAIAFERLRRGQQRGVDRVGRDSLKVEEDGNGMPASGGAARAGRTASGAGVGLSTAAEGGASGSRAGRMTEADGKPFSSPSLPHYQQQQQVDGRRSVGGGGGMTLGCAAGSDLSEEQSLKLTNERFLVPEALFRPIDIGINQAGLAECIVTSVEATPPELHPLLYANVLLVGGCSLFPGFVERLDMELRALVPDDFELNIFLPDDPILELKMFKLPCPRSFRSRGNEVESSKPIFHKISQRLTRTRWRAQAVTHKMDNRSAAHVSRLSSSFSSVQHVRVDDRNNEEGELHSAQNTLPWAEGYRLSTCGGLSLQNTLLCRGLSLQNSSHFPFVFFLLICSAHAEGYRFRTPCLGQSCRGRM
ncbi:hypothetical protein CBR_g55542 [Chara braunii]|uniref:Actin-related protein 6 n=1 Tax=Chara braunii TaxID=69332 RepID=A0A388MD20_CHABU|nr:hypothetical protein CBR_g55542 [Chara braunii]|eukprot:GBG92461.1 hypothetical protein CBR_g55542 [Chara braunii]